MKILTFAWAVIAFVCPELLLLANDDLVKIHFNDQVVMARQLVKGHVNLYVSHQFVEKKVTGPFYRTKKKVYVKRYFLKMEEWVELVTPYNYKRIIKKHLPNAPDLHRRLGRVGFRYDNLPSIVHFYNEFCLDEEELPEERPTPALEVGGKK